MPSASSRVPETAAEGAEEIGHAGAAIRSSLQSAAEEVEEFDQTVGVAILLSIQHFAAEEAEWLLERAEIRSQLPREPLGVGED